MGLTLWDRFTHWMVKDWYTYEQRALVLEEARRLKMKNDLQAERIRKRREREEADKESFQVIAVWECKWNRKENGKSENRTTHLSLSRNAVTGRTKVIIKGTLNEDGYATDEPGIDLFEKFPTFIYVIQPWMQGSITDERLGEHEAITVVAEL